MKEILAGRSDDFLGTTNFLTIFLFEDLSGRRTSRYRRRPGFSSPSMPLLVFWPHAGAWGAGIILPPCAQLLWHELYVMKNKIKKKKKKLFKATPSRGANCLCVSSNLLITQKPIAVHTLALKRGGRRRRTPPTITTRGSVSVVY